LTQRVELSSSRPSSVTSSRIPQCLDRRQKATLQSLWLAAGDTLDADEFREEDHTEDYQARRPPL